MTFRIAAIVLFGLLLSIGLPHRIRAATSKDDISRKEEGVPVMVLLRLFGFSMWIGLLVYMINPQWMAWSSLDLPAWLRWAGAVAVLVSIPLIYWMFQSLGKNVTDTVAIRDEHRLVTEGPYRFIRHPMYSFSLLSFIGFSLLTANWFIGLTGLIALAILSVRTPMEEAKLEEKFGDAYRAYRARTGRYIPKF